MKQYLVLCGACLSGCAVYVPTVPSTPLLREKGEVEITAAARSLSSLEAGAAWSPARRLLVAAEGAVQTRETSETSNNVTASYRSTHRQVGLGVGTYWLLGQEKSVYLGALGGVGVAKANVYDQDIARLAIIIPIPGPHVKYQATYMRYYGQLYAAWQRPKVSYGLSVRSTLVNYTKLLRDDTAIEPANKFFLEPTAFVRVGKGPLQAMATLGVSLPGSSAPGNPYRQQVAPTSSLIGFGVVLRPHLLQSKQSTAVQE